MTKLREAMNTVLSNLRMRQEKVEEKEFDTKAFRAQQKGQLASLKTAIEEIECVLNNPELEESPTYGELITQLGIANEKEVEAMNKVADLEKIIKDLESQIRNHKHSLGIYQKSMNEALSCLGEYALEEYRQFRKNAEHGHVDPDKTT